MAELNCEFQLVPLLKFLSIRYNVHAVLSAHALVSVAILVRDQSKERLYHLLCDFFKLSSSQITEEHVSAAFKLATEHGTISSVVPYGARKPVKITIVVPVPYRMAHSVLERVANVNLLQE